MAGEGKHIEKNNNNYDMQLSYMGLSYKCKTSFEKETPMVGSYRDKRRKEALESTFWQKEMYHKRKRGANSESKF